MAAYRYKAKTEDGKNVTGTMEAADEAALHRRLKEENLYLVSCHPAEKKGRTRRMKAKDLADFSRQLGMLLKAGVPLVRAMGIVLEEESLKPAYRAVFQDVLTQIRQGNSLSEAMKLQGDVFPPLMIEMFRSSEASGELAKTALRMGEHYEKEHKLNTKVSNAMVYPAIMCVLLVTVVTFLLTFVLPRFEELFAQMEVLPLPTRILYAIVDFVTGDWPVLLVVLIVLIFAGIFIMNIPAMKVGMDYIKIHLPVVGRLMKVIYTARFARSLSSLYASGLPIGQALQISRKIVGNHYIDSQFDQVISGVRAGETLAESLRKVDGFVKKLSSSVMIGEQTGSLGDMLEASADTLDYEAEMAVARLTTFLEPVLIVVMAVIVGFIMLAVIMPIYGSYNAIETLSSY